jgi:CheY-like chemotaxis protein
MSVTSKAKKILIIDDEKPIVDLISDVLEKYSYEPIVATKWTDAIDAISNKSPDLILLDLKMPTIDGPSLLEFIRKEGIELPVIIVSGFITDEVAADLSELGVNGFVKKPFKVVQLKEAIEGVIGPGSQPIEEKTEAAESSAPPTIDSLYSRPPEPPPEPEDSTPADSGRRDEDAGVLQAFQKLGGNAPDPGATNQADTPPNKDDEVLKAFQKLSGAKTGPPAGPDAQLPQAEKVAPGGDQVLQAFERLGTAKKPPPQPTSEPIRSVPDETPAEPASSTPIPSAATHQPQAPEPAQLDRVSLDETLGSEIPSPTKHPSPKDVAHHHHPHRKPPRSRAMRSRSLMLYGAITMVCIVVASFLAVIKWWEAQGGAEELKKKATKSMKEQGKEEILRELMKQK